MCASLRGGHFLWKGASARLRGKFAYAKCFRERSCFQSSCELDDEEEEFAFEEELDSEMRKVLAWRLFLAAALCKREAARVRSVSISF